MTNKKIANKSSIARMHGFTRMQSEDEYIIKNNSLIIQFPKDFAGKKLTGETVLYCPSDENKDFKKEFSVKDEPLKIDLPLTTNGLYQLQLSWQDGGITYYFEKKIYI